MIVTVLGGYASLVLGQVPVGEPLPADVRLVIDVSGSMKRNDPGNLRQPAVKLLMQLLPEESKAGVWTFGKLVNMLVPHQPVSQKWRDAGQDKAVKINSVGLFTNIGEALEKAAYDIKSPPKNHRISIILLTDGMVDIAKDPQANKREWRRIVDEILPRLKRAGYTIHTIALSDNADIDLLNKLSLGTGGIAEVAHSADDLMKIFLKTFDVSAPSEKVPFDGNGFLIDSSVEEFTALIFRQNRGGETVLIGPDQEQFQRKTKSKYLKWYRGDNYDLITVKRPLEGEWMVQGDMDPNSRVTVVSNLNLRVNPLLNNVFKGEAQSLKFLLQEDGNTIKRAEFLSLMTIQASIDAGRDEFDLREIWRETIPTDVPPSNGIFSILTPTFDKDGIYQLTISVDGKSFVREFNHQFTVRQPFDAEVKQVFSGGALEYRLIVRSFRSDIDIGNTLTVATITAPDGSKKILPLPSTDVDTWRSLITPFSEGQYSTLVRLKGKTTSGSGFDVTLPVITFNYNLDKGFVEEEAEFFESPEVTPEPSAEPTPEPADEPKSEEVAADAEPKSNEEGDLESNSLPDWLLYTGLGMGNILLFGLGFFAFRMIMSGKKEKEILDEFSDEKIAEAPEPEEQEPEEEPPMEDLDPIDESDMAQPDPDPEEEVPSMDDSMADGLDDMSPDSLDEDDDDDDLVNSMMNDMLNGDDDDDGGGDGGSGDSEDANNQLSAADFGLDEDAGDGDDPMDELDDLDAMAVEEESKLDDAFDDAEEEEEDMVTAMLKAQGLDLAEEELDDAISSLIDDLDNDDFDDSDS
ncbi:MAG: VWA domain-containing protein [Alteromonadaceae bacterium]|nr:MAG: VWA domain-containing protein [Alteromonadaceae bacterium]